MTPPPPWREVTPPKPIRCRVPVGVGQVARPVIDAVIVGLHENESCDFPILVEIVDGTEGGRRYTIRPSDIEQA